MRPSSGGGNFLRCDAIDKVPMHCANRQGSVSKHTYNSFLAF